MAMSQPQLLGSSSILRALDYLPCRWAEWRQLTERVVDKECHVHLAGVLDGACRVPAGGEEQQLEIEAPASSSDQALKFRGAGLSTAELDLGDGSRGAHVNTAVGPNRGLRGVVVAQAAHCPRRHLLGLAVVGDVLAWVPALDTAKLPARQNWPRRACVRARRRWA